MQPNREKGFKELVQSCGTRRHSASAWRLHPLNRSTLYLGTRVWPCQPGTQSLWRKRHGRGKSQFHGSVMANSKPAKPVKTESQTDKDRLSNLSQNLSVTSISRWFSVLRARFPVVRMAAIFTDMSAWTISCCRRGRLPASRRWSWKKRIGFNRSQTLLIMLQSPKAPQLGINFFK